jgi:hypothetical protein
MCHLKTTALQVKTNDSEEDDDDFDDMTQIDSLTAHKTMVCKVK